MPRLVRILTSPNRTERAAAVGRLGPGRLPELAELLIDLDGAPRAYLSELSGQTR